MPIIMEKGITYDIEYSGYIKLHIILDQISIGVMCVTFIPELKWTSSINSYILNKWEVHFHFTISICHSRYCLL